MLLSPLVAASLSECSQEHFWENEDRDITLQGWSLPTFASLSRQQEKQDAEMMRSYCFLLLFGKKKAVWFIVLTLQSSDSWAWWQKAKHTKETTVKLSSATRSREKISEVITYCSCLPCNKWQLLRAAIWTIGPLEELQLSAASLGQAGPQHLFPWPLSKGPLWLQAKRCFDTLSASTVIWVYFPGLVRRPALARPPPGAIQSTLDWAPEPSWAHKGQATNCVLLPPLAKSLGHRADLGRALSGSRIIQIVCVFLVERPLRGYIRIFKEQEQILS